MKTTKTAQLLCSLVAGFLALTAFQANGQTVVNSLDGDIFFGIRAADTTNSYLVDIGQASIYRDAAPGSTITISQTIVNGTDISNIQGADWYTRQFNGTHAAFWAVMGARQFTDGTDPNNTLYSTNPSTTPWLRHSNSTQGVTRSLYNSLSTTYNGSISTSNSTSGVEQSNASQNTWATFQPGGANSGGISFQTWNPTNEGGPSDILYFDRIIPGTGASVQIGWFTLGSDGTLTFFAEPVPDAVNTASLFAGALLLLGLMDWQRRRTLNA